MIQFSKLSGITGGKNISLVEDTPIEHLLLDSRKATSATGTLFFAINGVRHNGHEHLNRLYDSGFRNFVVESEAIDVARLNDANILLVKSSVRALQAIGKFHRETFSYPVIGITGSNGKTIIKEWLFQILMKYETPVKNPGSYNSQVGVPLSVWQMKTHHTVGIFEAGISQVGEMDQLREVIQPTLGLFTNIGSAHDEGFRSIEEKIREKLRLFSHAEVVIYCKDHNTLDDMIQATQLPTISWGTSGGADIRIRPNGHGYDIWWKAQHVFITLPFKDKASIENCFHVLAVLMCMGYNGSQIQDGINNLKRVPMRLELKEGINQCQVIDDTYNNDLGGIEISLQFLAQQHQKKKKTVILSDVLQSGESDQIIVKEIAARIHESGIHRFVGIGPSLKKFQHLFRIPSVFYTDTQEFLDHFNADLWQQEIILVKGARTFEFEKIVSRLQRKVHGTIMEIDLGALIHNFNFFKSRLKPSTKIMVMVKAFAYGSGSNEIANLLQYHQADYLGVAYSDEGVDLRKNNISLPIMVMNPSEDSFETLLQYQLEPEMYNFKILNHLIAFLDGRECKVHIKLDTGMHRLGFSLADVDVLGKLLRLHKNLSVASIFSHLAGADEHTHDEFSATQASQFEQGALALSKHLGYRPIFHLLNSPGILRLQKYQFDMVRLGIGLYGVDPTSDGFRELRPVATLKTVISHVQEVKKGDTIGYGRRGVAEHDMILGTIAIGYADGFTRAFSRGNGKVLVKGKRVPVVGNVCMDMTMIDLTGIEVTEGEEVIIFGRDLPIQDVAASISTIPYEILTNTSERVKRIFVSEGI
jgi:Alr-MurF fusion protein